MNIESWCSVERTPDQEWMRSERKHVKDPFKSSVFSDKTPPAESVTDDPKHCRPDLDSLKKRKHFPQKCEFIR